MRALTLFLDMQTGLPGLSMPIPKAYLDQRLCGQTRSTVPFQLIRPSRVTGLLVLAEIHWLSHVTGEFTCGPSHPMMKKLLKRLCYVRNVTKSGRWPNSKFHPLCHGSHPRPNWLKWYSTMAIVLYLLAFWLNSRRSLQISLPNLRYILPKKTFEIFETSHFAALGAYIIWLHKRAGSSLPLP